MPAAYLFPGQGSQQVGMGRQIHDAFAQARETFAQANEVLGFDLRRLCLEGPEPALRQTANLQPALLTVEVATWRALQVQSGRVPAFVAGHSLGEYAALVAAGALDFGDALRLVRLRGEAMQTCVPEGLGGMLALIGLEDGEVEVHCREVLAALGDPTLVLAPANFNCPGQVVVSGHIRATDALRARLPKSRAMPLRVSAPFHCPLMRPAADALAPALAATRFAAPACPIVANADAAAHADPADFAGLLTRQITAPVLWTQSMRRVLASGTRLFVEIGPGAVLAGLLRRIGPHAEVVGTDTADTLDRAATRLICA